MQTRRKVRHERRRLHLEALEPRVLLDGQLWHFAAPEMPALMFTAPVIGDLDGDGDMDVGYRHARIDQQTFEMFGGGAAIEGATGNALWTTAETDGMDMGLGVGDVTGDGADDLVTLRASATQMATWVEVFAGRTGETVATRETHALFNVILGDFEGNGTLGVLVESDGGKFQVWAPSSDSVLWTSALDAGEHVTLLDWNGDGIPDILSENDEAGDRAVILSGATGGLLWQQAAHKPPGAGWADLFMLPDISGNAVPEVLYSFSLHDGQGGRTQTLHMRDSETGDFLWQREGLDSFRENGVSLGDLNGDGATDIVAVFHVDEQEGLGGLLAISGATGETLWRVEIAEPVRDWVPLLDLNGNGELDLLAVTDHALRGYRGADGAEIWEYDTGGSVFFLTPATLADLNGDGRVEAVVGSPDGVRAITTPAQSAPGEVVWAMQGRDASRRSLAPGPPAAAPLRIVAHELDWAHDGDGHVLQSVAVTFSEPVAPGAFSPQDVLIAGVAGADRPDAVVEVSGGTVFRIEIPSSQDSDIPHLTIGPDIVSLSGRGMDQSPQLPGAQAYEIATAIGLEAPVSIFTSEGGTLVWKFAAQDDAALYAMLSKGTLWEGELAAHFGGEMLAASGGEPSLGVRFEAGPGNVYTLVVEAAPGAFGEVEIQPELPRLAPDAPVSGSLPRVEDRAWFAFSLAGGEAVALEVEASFATTFEILAREGALPTEETYDYFATGFGTHSLILPDPAPGPHYVMLRPTTNLGEALGAFELRLIEDPLQPAPAVIDSDTVLSGQFERDGDMSVENGATLTLPEDSELAVLGRMKITDGSAVLRGDLTLHQGADVQSGSTLTLGGHVAVLGRDITIAEGAELVIEPGTVVKFGAGRSLRAFGGVHIAGEHGKNVFLTSILDDSVGKPHDEPGEPTPGAWRGLVVGTAESDSAQAGISIEHAEIRYATHAVNAYDLSRNVPDVHIRMANVTLRRNEFGVHVWRPFASTEIVNAVIVDNDLTGIFVRADSSHSIRNATIVGNGFAGAGMNAAAIHGGGATIVMENSIVAFNNNGLHHIGDPPVWAFRANVFHNPDGEEIIWATPNPGKPDLTADRNVLADPLFADLAAGDLELGPGSPAVDSALGYRAPAKDILGRPRYDDPGVPNTGSGQPAYADRGAFERQETTDSANLSVAFVSPPSSAFVSPGDEFSVSWTVANTGVAPTGESWRDKVYLSANPWLGPDDILLATVERQGALQPGRSYTGEATVTAPDGAEGAWYLLVHANADREPFEAVRWDNVAAAEVALGIGLDTLQAGDAVSGEVGPGAWNYYRLVVPAERSVKVALEGHAEMRVRRDLPPTLADYDVAGAVSEPGTQEAVLGRPGGAEYLLGVYGRPTGSGSHGYALSAELTELAIDRVGESAVGAAGTATVHIVGAGFTEFVEMELLGEGGFAVGGDVWFASESAVYATFDLAAAGAAPGTYSLRASLPEGDQHLLEDALVVVPGGASELEASILVPDLSRPARMAEIAVKLANRGMVDIAAPALTLGSNEPMLWRPQGAGEDDWVSGEGYRFLGISPDGPASVLRPGQSVKVALEVFTPFIFADVELTLHQVDESEPLDWPAFEEGGLRPPGLPDEGWEPLLERFRAQVGETWGGAVGALRANADHLAFIGQRTGDMDALFDFEMNHAAAVGAGTLEVEVDAVCPVPGMPLEFERRFQASLMFSRRLGALGRGWSHSWETSLSVENDEVAVVRDSSGFDRAFFWADGQWEAGWEAGAPEAGTLETLADGAYRLTEHDGTIYQYHSDGRLDFREDRAGNRATAEYDADGRLASIHHSNGEGFAFEYNDDGRLVRLEDYAGRAVEYAYDASGEFLASVTPEAQDSTTFTYVREDGALRDGLLAEAHRPGGVVAEYAYDALGRLVSETLGGGLLATGYAYDATGQMAIFDGTGRSLTLWLDGAGRPVRLREANGAVTTYHRDGAGRVVSIEEPLSGPWRTAFNEGGHVTRITDPLRGSVRLGLEGEFGDLNHLVNQVGATFLHFVNDAGNLVALEYPDGETFAYQYDDRGLLTGITDALGQESLYEYNERGQVTKATLDAGGPNEQVFRWTYDAAGLLTSLEGPNGTETMEYVPGTDWIERYTDAQGRTFQYTYDGAGRRATSTDHGGYTLAYEYDAAGHLARLADGDGETLVEYEYDAAGRVAHIARANGVHTSMEYDAMGRQTLIVHYAEDGQELGRFEVAYDASGREILNAGPEGTWAYEYDAADRIVGAQFDPADPAEPPISIAYSYDAAGNRTETRLNGEVVEYVVDARNQYVRVGDALWEYNANGAPVRREENGETWTYEYDVMGRLIRAETPEGTWEYAYNAFGQIESVTRDGETTAFQNDPSAMWNVAAAYDEHGALIERHLYGDGLLAARQGAGGDLHFHLFDDDGHLWSTADQAGALAGRMAYDPFGQVVSGQPDAGVGFLYGGEYGALSDGSGLIYMRNRFLDPETGRFLTPDPAGFIGGDANLYAYVRNNPTNLMDPMGLMSMSDGTSMANTGVGGGATAMDLSGMGRAGTRIAGRMSAGVSVGMGMYDFHQGMRSGNTGQAIYGGATVGLTVAGLLATGPVGWTLLGASVALSVAGVFIDFETLRLLTSITPEDKFGPEGPQSVGLDGETLRFFDGEGPLTYRVEFWNEEDALVPTQDAEVIDYLDPDIFDLDTLRFTRVGFLQWDKALDDLLAVNTQIDCRDEMELVVNVVAELDPATSTILWHFQAIDPSTGRQPDDPFLGFLPPFNPETQYELGWVEFTVELNEGLPEGTRVENQAFVRFDFDGEFEDNPAPPYGPWINVLDLYPPVSAVEALPEETFGEAVTVSWGGDDGPGSGIASYDIYVSQDGGDWTLWLDNTEKTSAEFVGAVDSTYGFYSVATDRLGRVEDALPEADATTTVRPAFHETVLSTAPGHNRFAFHDDDGDLVTVIIAGREGELRLMRAAEGDEPGDLLGMVAENVTNANAITVLVARGATTRVGDVSISGSLRLFNARSVDLLGDFEATGSVGRLWLGNVAGPSEVSLGQAEGPFRGSVIQFGEVQDLALTSEEAILALTLTSWRDAGGAANAIAAPSIQRLAVRGDRRADIAGDFAAALNLADAAAPWSLGTAVFQGAVSGHEWALASGARLITASAFGNGWGLDAAGDVLALRSRGDLEGTVRANSFNVVHAAGVISGAVEATGANARGVSVGRLAADRAAALDVAAAGLVNLVALGSWEAGTLAADAAGAVRVQGDLAAAFNLPADQSPFALRLAFVRGTLGSGDPAAPLVWNLGGDVGTVNADAISGWDLRLEGDLLRAVRSRGDLEGTVRANSFNVVHAAGDISGAVEATGANARGVSVGRLAADRAAALDVAAAGLVNLVALGSWEAGTLVADAAGAVRVQGDLAAAFDLPADQSPFALRLAFVRGTLGSGDPAAPLVWNLGGDLWTVNADAVSGWDLNLEGDLRFARLGHAEQASMAVEGDAGAVVAAQWETGALEARTLGRLAITGSPREGLGGDFGADLTLNGTPENPWALRMANVRGEAGGQWTVAQNDAGSITAGSFADSWRGDFARDVTAVRALGDMAGHLSARSINLVNVRGDMDNARVELARPADPAHPGQLALGRLSVAGWMDGSRLDSAGHVGAIVAGGLRESEIRVGLAPAAPNLATSPADFAAEAAVDTLRVAGVRGHVGPSVVDSAVSAWRFGRAIFSEVDTTSHSGRDLGLATVEGVGVYLRWTPDGWERELPDEQDDWKASVV